MLMDLLHSVDAFFDALGPWWLEVCFVIAFPLGYYFLEVFGRKPAPGKSDFPKVVDVVKDGGAEDLQKKVEEAVATSDMIGALKHWRKVEDRLASSSETLKLVVQALCSVSPGTLVDELAKHLEAHRSRLCNGKIALIILDAVGHGQPSKLLDEVCEMLRGRLGIPMTYQLYEVLVAGHAFADDSKRVDEICEEVKSIGQKLTARAFALIIKGFLCKGNLDVGLKYAGVMRRQGFYVPPFAVSLLFKVAAEADRVKDVFETCLDGGIMLPHETITFAFEDCLRRGDLSLASCIEACCRHGGELPATAFDPLLKVNVMACDNHACELWEEMVKAGVKITEGLCVGILARSAESKFLRFAEEVTKYCREKGMMSIAVYSALMKVYAYCGFHGRACDLYPEIIKSGLTPDGIMYGCLMRFSVECGRTELSQELSRIAPQLDTQSYMSLIRAAGRDKDTNRAFQLLEELKGSGDKVDPALYNCVLDACVCAGDLARARELAATMREKFGRLDIVSYNTMLKGITATGDLPAAYTLLSEMELDGIKPNDISYNSIVNSAVSMGNFKEAWRAVDRMQQKGIKPDHYTVSIMLKALKSHGSSYEARKVFAMVEQLGIDVCSEEVLFSALLEACLRLNETKRIQELLAAYGKTGRKPSQHLYGGLIKACSNLKRLHKCREYWQEMVQERAMMPSDIVLGCMLDALVCNAEVSEAVALFREWKPKVGGNVVLYSTLVKGFAAAGRDVEAMEMWREIRAEGTKMNAVVYNSLIDAQARKGMTEEVATLFSAMKVDNIPADSITYSTMIKGHCVKNDMQKALELLKDMESEGLLKDCVVFNTILDYCTKNNQMSLADRVLEDFEKLKIPPSNFTVGILVKMYGRRRMLDKAFQVAEDMPKRWGFSKNPQVYTCLMSACLLNNNLPRAMKVFTDLRGQGADFKSYNVIITGCLRAGKSGEAAGLVEEAYGLNGQKRGLPIGQTLGNEILEQVIGDLSRQGLAEQAEQVALSLVAALHEAGVPVNSRLLTSAIRTTSKMEESKTGNRPAWRDRRQYAQQPK